jgi:hypothetical protein
MSEYEEDADITATEEENLKDLENEEYKDV